MHLKQPAPINPRITRAVRWAVLWLCGLQAFLNFVCAYGPLSRQANAIAQRRLDEFAWLTSCYIIGNAARLMPDRPRRQRGRPWRRRDAGLQRALIGGKLRRALRHRDPRARTAALIAILRDTSVWELALLRRFKHGLTRRAPITTIQRNAAPPRLCALNASIADTS